MDQTAIIIGQPKQCRRLEQQLDLLTRRPAILGWMLASSLPAPAPEFVERMVQSLASKRRSRDAATVAAAVRQFLPRRMESAVA